MENVLTAFIVMFILLFAVMTFSQVMTTSQETLAAARLEIETRLDEQITLEVIHTEVTSDGSLVKIVLLNAGNIKATDMPQWDVIVQYEDASEVQYIQYLPYGQWQIDRIELAPELPELAEIGFVNPGEQITLSAALVPPVSQNVIMVVAPSNGVPAVGQAMRNHLPELLFNSTLTAVSNTMQVISAGELQFTDADDVPAHLTYTITSAPTEGTLNLGNIFTQAQINAGQLLYTHQGATDDHFEFMLSDGKDSLGAFTFLIHTVPPLPVTGG